MSATQITAFNQSGMPGIEQAIVFGWVARYFESICDEVSAENCRNISEILRNQSKGQQEVKP